jgi:hypothetical protein
MLSPRRRLSAPGGDFVEDGSMPDLQTNDSEPPSEELLTSFWERIAVLTTRTCVNNVWVGAEELYHWNRANLVVSTRFNTAS